MIRNTLAHITPVLLGLVITACGNGSGVGVGGSGGSGGGAGGSGPPIMPLRCDPAVQDSSACPESMHGWRCTVYTTNGPMGACFSEQINCASAVDCDGNGMADNACPCDQLVLACPGLHPGKCGRPGVENFCESGRSLMCPEADKPFYCASTGLCYPGDGRSVDCGTLADCDGDNVPELGCPCGSVPDCTTGTCTPKS